MPVTARPDPAPSSYAFGNDHRAAANRHDLLAGILDRYTTSRLELAGELRGRRCLELGAGRGSIAAWLVERVGPAGRVVATDIDTRHLDAEAGYEVLRHDLTAEPPPEGPWDLIHARLVLGHLPGRREILGRLASALAPGGVLALEEWDNTHRAGLVVAAPDDEAAELFYAYQTVMAERILPSGGADHTWAHRIHAAMLEEGLVDLDSEVHARCWPGGSSGGLLHAANIDQLQERLLAAGMTADQLDRLRALARDPRMVVRGILTFSTMGHRPSS